jgi:hypothetical protein
MMTTRIRAVYPAKRRRSLNFIVTSAVIMYIMFMISFVTLMENIKKGNERKHNLRGCANPDKDNHEKLVQLFEMPKLSENDSAKQNKSAKQKKSTRQNGSHYLRRNLADHPSTFMSLNKRSNHGAVLDAPIVYEYL